MQHSNSKHNDYMLYIKEPCQLDSFLKSTSSLNTFIWDNCTWNEKTIHYSFIIAYILYYSIKEQVMLFHLSGLMSLHVIVNSKEIIQLVVSLSGHFPFFSHFFFFQKLAKGRTCSWKQCEHPGKILFKLTPLNMRESTDASTTRFSSLIGEVLLRFQVPQQLFQR